MAEGDGGAQAGGGRARRAQTPEPEKKQQEPTTYVILQRIESVRGARPSPVDGSTEVGEFPVAWVVVDEQTARSQGIATEAYTGKGDGAKVGVFRPVAASSWKGAVEVKPPKPILEDVREVLD